MKTKLLYSILALLMVSLSWGQLSEGFESGLSTSGYVTLGGTKTLASGIWSFDNSGLRSTSSVHGGTYACQLKTGATNYAATPSLASCGVVTFWWNTSTPPTVKYGATTYTTTQIATSGLLYQFSTTVNSLTANSVYFYNASGVTAYLDDVSITAYTPSIPILAITGTTAHGSVCPTVAATPITYTITNSGTVAATGVTVVSNDSQFVVSGLSSTTIAANGGTVTYTVTFTPSSAGAKTATITVASVTSGSNSPTSSLSGTGLSATQAVTSSSASSISTTTATLNGNVTSLGLCPSTTEKGFVYSVTTTNGNPLNGGTGVTKTAVASLATGAYTLPLTGLTSGVNYSFKSYVFDGTTYTYGSVFTFTTTLVTPTLTATTSPTSVDSNFTVTFPTDSAFASAITSGSITIGGVTLVAGTDYIVSGNNTINFTPTIAGNSSIHTPGTYTITVNATGYAVGTISQILTVGVATKLLITTQPTAPVTNGASLAAQPVIRIVDQYGNITASTASITAAATGGTWTLGGTNSVAAISGSSTFSGLTATSAAAVATATITFTSPGLASVVSNSFTIPAPAPVNDLCGNATVLTQDGSSLSGTLVNSTVSFATTRFYDIWYTFTANCTGTFTVTSATTNQDIDFYVFTGSSCPSVSSGYTSSAATSSSTTTETVSFSVTSGTVYYIRVTISTSSSPGAFTISGSGVLLPVVTSASPSGITGSAFSYSIVATNSPTSYAVASGSLPTGLTLNTSTGAITGTPTVAGSSSVTVTATNCAGTSVAATLNFTILAPITNDLCGSATALTVNAVATVANMTGATFTSPFSKKDVWFSFTPSCSGTHIITVTGFSGDVDIELFSGSCPTTTTYLDNSSGSTSTETIAGSLSSGITYFIRVLAFDVTAETSGFTVQVTTDGTLSITNAGSPATGNISAGTSNAVIMGFSATPNCASSYTLSGITITKTGTSTTADISNIRVFYDANNNGIVDGGETTVSGTGIALATSMAFTLSGQTGITGTRNYLLVADFASLAVNGNTITASIASSSSVTATISPSGTIMGNAVGNTQTISTPACTAAVLSSITPSSGPAGTEVTITASSGNLTGATVKFSGITATVVSTSATTVVAIVPAGATTGNITVTDSTPCNATIAFTVISQDKTSCQGGNLSSDLFISEVTDSNTGSLTYVEIFNGTGATINLSGYSVNTASNGGSSFSNTVALYNVNLASGGIYVVGLGVVSAGACSIPGGDGSYANQTSGSGSVNFTSSGNDFIGLYKGATLVDSWGIYTNANWASSLVATIGTEGSDFKRVSSATVPNAIYSNADWVITDFSGTVCANNDYSGIGNYVFATAVAPTVTTQPSYTPTCKSASLTVAGTEGYNVLGLDTKELVYQWYFAAPGATSWTALADTGVYTGSTAATLLLSNVSGLNNYQYFCQIREDSNTCYSASNAVKIVDSTITWNGTDWRDTNNSIATPSINKLAIINANYNTTTNGSFDACSLLVKAGFVATITASHYINIQNDLTVNATATLNIENSGSLVQIDDAGVNTGSIAMQRTTNIRKTDYVYWSSPVGSFPVNSISPTTNYIYKWNTTVVNSNNGQGDWQSASGNTMSTGIGYIVRGPSANSSTTPSDYTATFTGVPNNGVVNVPINRGNYTLGDYPGTNGTTITNYDDNMNLIGNPYPSAIKALDFLNANASIEGSVQIWTHGTQLSNAIASPYYGSFAYNYTSADYITYNGTGTTDGPLGFNGYIGAGQSFFVKMKDGATGSGTVTFNNALRNKAHSNNQFYRISNPNTNHPQVIHTQNSERHRIWLDLIAPTGTAVRTLVGYVEGATLDKDRMYDAYSDYQNDQNFFSLIGKEIMNIQGRPLPFDVNDAVPMGVAIPKAGNYTIAIAAVDGLFEDRQQTIYLEDKLLNVVHNLSASPYTFSIVKGIVKDRFVLRYTDKALGTIDFKTLNNSVVVASKSNQMTIKSFIEDIKNIEIYDVLGREVFAKNNVNAMEFLVKDLNLSQQALLIKITLANGQTVVKKSVY